MSTVRTWRKPDYESRVCELADDLALKQTGREFDELPNDMQMKVWMQAEREVTDSIVSEAEYRRDAMLEGKMGL